MNSENSTTKQYQRDEEIISALEVIGMIRKGHFRGQRTGRHFHTHIDSNALFASPTTVHDLAKKLSENVVREGVPVDAVAGPALGGLQLASQVAFHLARMTGSTVPCVALEKSSSGGLQLRPQFYPLIKAKNVLVCDDVCRTGDTLVRARLAIEKVGGITQGFAVVLRRIPENVERVRMGAPVFVCTDYAEDGFDEDAVPAWLSAIPIQEGRRQKVLIGVTGKIGSGKSTFIREFMRLVPDSEKVATGDVLRETLSLWRLPQTRERLLQLSTILREHLGPDVIVEAVRKRIEESNHKYILVDGVRGKRVLSLLREYDNSILVAVLLNDEKRYGRISMRGEKEDEHTMTKSSFQQLDEPGFQRELESIMEEADVVVDNEGSLKELQTAVAQIADSR